MSSLKTNIIRIGNSQGIRLPKTVLQQCGLKDKVELEIEDDQIIIKPIKNPREGWTEAFRKMAKNRVHIPINPTGDSKNIRPGSERSDEDW